MNLQRILDSLYYQSYQTEKPARTTLGKGLEVSFWVKGPYDDQEIWVQLMRKNVFPSERELKTVLEHFPKVVEQKNLTIFKHQGKFYLKILLKEAKK